MKNGVAHRWFIEKATDCFLPYHTYKHLQEVMTSKTSHFCSVHESKIKTLHIKKLTLRFPKITQDAEDKKLKLSPNVYKLRVDQQNTIRLSHYTSGMKTSV